ncbi:hypothetical protein DUI87_17421 [Hirundo rustica rustica]|uniref:Uncharacterized protein n=1 Tax=Hirundo rustica rustica TaxID=333673 RepID=A0A3M0JYP9_HIRRU|nr:hypothetical protein DUI87_17421 [Hirundo rustica rustica]
MEWLLLAVSPQVGLINPDIIHFHGQRSHPLLLVNRSSLGVSRKVVQLVKWCLNRAVVSVKKELRHLKICSLVQLQKSRWGGLQRAAVFLLNSWRVKEVA